MDFNVLLTAGSHFRTNKLDRMSTDSHDFAWKLDLQRWKRVTNVEKKVTNYLKCGVHHSFLLLSLHLLSLLPFFPSFPPLFHCLLLFACVFKKYTGPGNNIYPFLTATDFSFFPSPKTPTPPPTPPFFYGENWRQLCRQV